MLQAIATRPLAPARPRIRSRVRPVSRAVVPAAPGLPLIANAVDLLVNPLAFFVRSYHTVGPVFRAAGPGRGYTVLAGPEEIGRASCRERRVTGVQTCALPISLLPPVLVFVRASAR